MAEWRQYPPRPLAHVVRHVLGIGDLMLEVSACGRTWRRSEGINAKPDALECSQCAKWAARQREVASE